MDIAARTTDMLRGFPQEGVPSHVFAVGGHISDVSPISFAADLHEVEGRPIVKT